MKLRIKLILCAALVLFAAASLLAVLGELGVLEQAEPGGGQQGYQLRVWEGRLALFSPPDAERPETVTDVYVRTLPTADRVALTRGVLAADRDSAARLLEDYGA